MAGRPRLTLLERVLEDSFRPGRYAHLLDVDELPQHPPERWMDPERWADVLDAQRRYRDGTTEASEFSMLVGALHGRPLPEWYTPPRVDGLTKASLPWLE